MRAGRALGDDRRRRDRARHVPLTQRADLLARPAECPSADPTPVPGTVRRDDAPPPGRLVQDAAVHRAADLHAPPPCHRPLRRRRRRPAASPPTARGRSARARASGPRRSAARPSSCARTTRACGVDVVERLSMVDYGDAPTVPGYHLESLERIEAFLRPVHEAGVVPLCLGGDHSMVLAELRAAACGARPAGAGAPRRARRRLGPVLRGRALPRDRVQARRRGGPRSTPRAPSRPVCAGRSTARATRGSRRAGLSTPSRWRNSRALARGVRRARPHARRRHAGLPVLRRRLRRPGVRTRDGDPGGRRPDQRRGDGLPAGPDAHRLPRHGLRRAVAAGRPAGITAWLAASACHEMLSLLALRRA